MKRAMRKYLGSVLALLGMVVLALGIAAYILEQQRFRFPLIEEKPKIVEVELENAQAVTPGQGQTVRVAGVQIGAIGKVKLEDGRAVVELEIDKEYEDLIRADATALLRPKTGLKDMFIEVDPGDGRVLRERERIVMANTAQDVDPDEILSALDGDTREYLKLLIGGAGKGLEGRGEDLRKTFGRLEPLHRDLARVNGAIARRRASLKDLISDYGSLMTELSGKDRELTRLVGASNQVFSALAAERDNVAATVRRLPGALRQSERTLRSVDALGDELGPALESLRPAFRRLDETNAAVRPFVREAAPIVRDRIRPFARAGQPFLRALGPAARDVARTAPDVTSSLEELNRFFNIGAFNPNGREELTGDPNADRNQRREGFLYWLAWNAQNGVSVFNTADAQGVMRRITLCGLTTGSALDMLGAGIGDAIAEGTVAPGQVAGILTTLVGNDFGTCEFRPPSG